MLRLLFHPRTRRFNTQHALCVGTLLLMATPAAAQQCLGLAPTAQTRAAFTQEASRGGSATVDRSRLMIALSRAMSLTASAVRTTYLDTQGMPWEAAGPALQVSIEGPTDGSAPYRICPMVEVSGLRSNVANWVVPQEWKMTRFAPGIAAGRAHAIGPDVTLLPFAAGSLVFESLATVQPSTSRETRSYAVVEVGMGVVLYKVLVLRLGVPVPVGRREGYPGPYTMRTYSATVAWSR